MKVNSRTCSYEGIGKKGQESDIPVGSDVVIRPKGPVRRILCSLSRSKIAMFGVVFLISLCVVVLLSKAIAPHDPYRTNLRNRLAPPVWVVGGSFDHVFGTDGSGRDILSRLIEGARISLLVGFSAVVIAGSFGILMGVLAGYLGGIVDSIIMRLVDLQLSFPSMFVGLIAMALLGAGVFELIVVISFVQWAYYARVVRAEIIKIKGMEYYLATKVVGVGTLRTILLHVLPNSYGHILIVASFSLANAIFYESALSFFGLGVPVNIPTWGNMLADARNVMLLTFWYPVIPGLAIFLTVLSFNFVGDWLRDYYDVKTLD